MIRSAATILGKDLRLRVRDRSVVLFALVVPLGLTVLFSFIMPGDEDLTFTAAVVDEDGGEASAAFDAEVLPVLVDQGLVNLRPVDDADAARAALDDGTLDAVWLFPDGFTEQLQATGAAELDVLVNADRALRAEIARAIAESYASQLDRIALAVATASTVDDGEFTAQDLEAVIGSAVGAEALVAVGDLVAEDRQLDATSYLAAGMAAFFVFFTVQFGVTGLLEEGQLGTLPRLLASPIHPGAVQLGKAAGAFLLGIVSMTVLAVASSLFLDAEWGPPAGVAVLIVALVVAAIGLMSLVGTFAKTAEQAGNLQSIVAVVLGMLGGVFFPVPLGEGIFQYLTRVAPHGWFLRGLGDQLGSGRWTEVLPSAGAIAVFGLVAGGFAALRLRRAVRW